VIIKLNVNESTNRQIIRLGLRAILPRMVCMGELPVTRLAALRSLNAVAASGRERMRS
jgi:hypothetical protein